MLQSVLLLLPLILLQSRCGSTLASLEVAGLEALRMSPVPRLPLAPVMTGPAVVVWNAFFDTCGAHGTDNVDSPARAFRDAAGTVHLVASGHTSRFMTGPTLYNVTHRCDVVHNSTVDANAAAFADYEWIHATQVAAPLPVCYAKSVPLVQTSYL